MAKRAPFNTSFKTSDTGRRAAGRASRRTSSYGSGNGQPGDPGSRDLTKWLALCLVGVVLLTVIAIAIPLHFKTQSALDRHTRDLLDSAISETRENATALLEQAERTVLLTRRLIGNDILSFEKYSELEHYFIAQLSSVPQIDAIYFAKPDGRFLFSRRGENDGRSGTVTKHIDRPDGVRQVQLIWRDDDMMVFDRSVDDRDVYDPRIRPWYTLAFESDTAIWTDPYIFFTSQEPGVTVAVSIHNAEGKRVGVVGVDIALNELSAFLSEQQSRFKGDAVILHRSGGVLAHPGSNSLSRVTDTGQFRLARLDEVSDLTAAAARNQKLKVFSEQDDVSYHSFRYDGAEHIAVFRPFLDQTRWPWHMGISVRSAYVATPLRGEQQRNLLLALLIGLVIVAGTLALSRGISAPLKALQRRAEEDPLTGLMNRRAFLADANEALRQANATERPIAAIMLDIDHFKRVNDGHGHQVGDEVLMAVAGRLQNALSDGDLLCRYGGEEFAVILPEMDVAQAVQVARRLHQVVREKPVETHNVTLPVTVSLGVASLDRAMTTVAELLDEADQRLLLAKRRGRDRVVHDEFDHGLVVVT